MISREERIKILTMIQEGKISPQEGIQLLESLDSVPSPRPDPQTFSPSAAKTARWFRVCVTDTKSGKTRVNVRLPVNVLSAGVKMGARFSPEVEGLDTNQLLTWIRSGITGKVLDVVDEKDGEHVEVFLEA